MSYITKESLRAAKQMDLLTYLQLCDPQNLVHLSGDTYCTREHDSLKISNGKWHWFSRHIGGRSALDYLIKVKGLSLPMAVEQINGYSTSVPVVSQPSQPKPKTICLPEPNASTAVVRRYLKSRGIHDTVIDFCIDNDLLYEDKRYHSAVFLGRDSAGAIRYTGIRSTGSAYKGEASGSDKHYSFRLPGRSDTVHVFESAIDALSFATLMLYQGQNWHEDHLLSLAGVFKTKRDDVVPVALQQYLKEHPQIRTIRLHLDKAEQPSVPEKAAPKRDELDDLLDQLMKKEPAKEAVIHENPTGARRAESSPSVPSSMTAEKAKSRMSVREELARIRAEQQKQSTKPVQQHKTPKKKKRKER